LYIKKKGKNLKIIESDLEHLVNAAKSSLGLRDPCKGRKFKDLFKQKKGSYIVDDYSEEDDDVKVAGED